jgi:hypothetical protein
VRFHDWPNLGSQGTQKLPSVFLRAFMRHRELRDEVDMRIWVRFTLIYPKVYHCVALLFGKALAGKYRSQCEMKYARHTLE